jgi:hypothetical protein
MLMESTGCSVVATASRHRTERPSRQANAR